MNNPAPGRFPFFAIVFGVIGFVPLVVTGDPWLIAAALAVVSVAGLVIDFWLIRRLGPGLSTPVVAAVLALLVFVAFAVRGWNELKEYPADKYALSLAQFGFSLALHDLALRRSPTRVRGAVWVALGLASAAAYPHWGRGHFGNFFHQWDGYHRSLNTKYFGELGLTRLYACTVVADMEAGKPPGFGDRVTDLAGDGYIDPFEYTRDPDASCKSHFSKERWDAFSMDVAAFRSVVGERRWKEFREDFGVRETPAWFLWGRMLSLVFGWQSLAMLDLVWLAFAGAMLLWAFGPRGFGVGLLVLGAHATTDFFFWTGGSLLRHESVGLLVAAVCLLKKGRPALAGGALAVASLLSADALLLFAGPLMLVLVKRPVAPALLKFLKTAGVTLAVGVVVSTAYAGLDAWPKYFANPVAGRPVTNHVGLGVLLSYRYDQTGEVLRDGNAEDPWGAWKAARRQGLAEARPLQVIVALALSAMLFLAVRRNPDAVWLAVALSVGLIPLVLERVNFRLDVLMVLGAAAALHRWVGVAIAGLCVATGVVLVAPTPDFSTWLDVQSVLISAFVVATVGVCWAIFAWAAPDGDETAAPAGR